MTLPERAEALVHDLDAIPSDVTSEDFNEAVAAIARVLAEVRAEAIEECAAVANAHAKSAQASIRYCDDNDRAELAAAKDEAQSIESFIRALANKGTE